MINGPVSFVKAVMDYFGEGEFGRKVSIPEFKELTEKDKNELKAMLEAEGYQIREPQTA